MKEQSTKTVDVEALSKELLEEKTNNAVDQVVTTEVDFDFKWGRLISFIIRFRRRKI